MKKLALILVLFCSGSAFADGQLVCKRAFDYVQEVLTFELAGIVVLSVALASCGKTVK